MMYININNLKVNEVIKNYKELCSILQIKCTTGGAKQKQISELELYCKYEKIGNKYIIKEVNKNPTLTISNIINNNNSKYIKLLANIILEYLYNNPNELKEIPISKLFVTLGITNNNYNDANYYRKELSQIYDIRLASIYYFYSNTKNEFKVIIERCLNNLKNRRVLNWYKVIMIKDANTKQIYKADKDTEKYIIDTEKEALEYLNKSNMYELMQDKEALKEFNNIVFKETNINYFYAYDLVIGEKALKIEFNNIQKDKQTLNNVIISRSETIFNKTKYKHFENDYKILNDLLLNIDNTDKDLLPELKHKRKLNIHSLNEGRYKIKAEAMQKENELINTYTDIYI